MNDESREARLTELTAAYLDHLEGGGPAPDISGLPERERADAEEHLRLLASLWGAHAHPAPPLDEDAVAIRLGFDRLSPTFRVSGFAIREARQARGIPTSELADELAARGHAIDRAELGAMERATSHIVPMELASALAAVLDTSVADLEGQRTANGGTRMSAEAFANDPLFISTISEWAENRGLDARYAVARQRERLLRLRHRGRQEMDAGEWRALLLDLLRTDEHDDS